MRILAIALFATLVVSSCVRPEKPEFRGVNNINIHLEANETVSVSGDAVFFNPNDFEMELTAMDITVKIDTITAGKLQDNTHHDIPATSEFSVPVAFDIPSEKVFENSLQMIGGVLSALGGKKYKVNFLGTVTVNVADMEWTLPVNETEEVSLVQ